MKKSISALVILTGVAFGGVARADFSPEYELDLFGGTHLWNPQGGVGRLDNTEASQVNHGGLLGIRFSVGLHRHFFLEGELGLSPSNTRGGEPNPKFDSSARVLGIGYRLQGLVHILTGRVKPYVLVGAGGFTTSSSNAAMLAQDTVYSIGAGGGVKVDLTQNFGLRLDGRALFQPGVFGGPAVTPDGEVSFAFFGRLGDTKVASVSSGVSDRDKDGITDIADLCPDVAGIPAFRGCPEAQGSVPPPVYVPPTPSVPLPPLPPPKVVPTPPPVVPPPATPPAVPPAPPPPPAPPAIPPATPPVWTPSSGTPIP